MDNLMIAFVILLASIFLARIINEKANKKLDQEKKAALVDVFSKDRIWTFGILIGIVVIFFLNTKFTFIDPSLAYIIYIAILVAYVAFLAYYSYTKLRTNDFPNFYIKSYVMSSSIRLIGFLIFITITGF